MVSYVTVDTSRFPNKNKNKEIPRHLALQKISIFEITTKHTHTWTYTEVYSGLILVCRSVKAQIASNINMQCSSSLSVDKFIGLSLCCWLGRLVRCVLCCCNVVVCSNRCRRLYYILVCISCILTLLFLVSSNSIKCNIHFLTFIHPSIHSSGCCVSVCECVLIHF